MFLEIRMSLLLNCLAELKISQKLIDKLPSLKKKYIKKPNGEGDGDGGDGDGDGGDGDGGDGDVGDGDGGEG